MGSIFNPFEFNPKYAFPFQMRSKLQENQTIVRLTPDANRMKSKTSSK